MKQIYQTLDYPKICDLYLKKQSTTQIAKSLNVSTNTINKVLHFCGIKLRTNSESHIGIKLLGQRLDKNIRWKGDLCKQANGNQRARRMYPCPAGKERHHIDGNPLNNLPENIAFVTRKEHQLLDGRLEKLRLIHPEAVKGRQRYCEQLRYKKIPEKAES